MKWKIFLLIGSFDDTYDRILLFSFLLLNLMLSTLDKVPSLKKFIYTIIFLKLN